MLRHIDEETGQEYLDIYDYASIIGRSLGAVRSSIMAGNRFRKLEAIKEGSRFYVLKDELFIYPTIGSGAMSTAVYHFDKDYKAEQCVECTLGKKCLKIKDGKYIGHEAYAELVKARDRALDIEEGCDD